jgi:hypothetical protein
MNRLSLLIVALVLYLILSPAAMVVGVYRACREGFRVWLAGFADIWEGLAD